jgi:hypothetical protein
MPRRAPSKHGSSNDANGASEGAAGEPTGAHPLAVRHLRFGWWSLLAFLTIGIALEALHGFKVQFYLAADNETRRLLWTLAHAHGTLFSLINLALAASLAAFPAMALNFSGFGSRCLIAATIVMPAGFFAGGAVIYQGDPGLGILLAPVGALFMVAAVILAGRAARHALVNPAATDAQRTPRREPSRRRSRRPAAAGG